MSEFQRAVERLTAVPGIGPALAARLARAGVRTRADLRKTTIRLPAATRAELQYSPCRAIPLPAARELTAEIAARLRINGRRPKRTRAVGSVRRQLETSGDLDILVQGSAPWREVTLDGDTNTGVKIVAEISGGSRQRMLVVWAPGLVCAGDHAGRANHAGRGEHIRVDLFRATRAEWPFALLHFSNGEAYEKKVRAHAKRRGFFLNDRGLFVRTADGAGAPVRAPAGGWTERTILERIGLTYRSPSKRAVPR